MKRVGRSEAAILVMAAIIVSLLGYIIFSNKPGAALPNDGILIKSLNDSIRNLKTKYVESIHHVRSLEIRYDSLNSVKSKIEIKYQHDVQFIQGATPDQLDSVIRSAWSSY